MDLKALIPALQLSQTGAPLSRTAALPQTADLTGDPLAFSVAGMLKGLLDKTAVLLNEQETLLQLLSPQIRTHAQQIIQHSLPDINILSDGLVSVLNSRREATQSLTQLAEKLQLAASILEANQDKPAELLNAVRHFTQQVTKTLAQFDVSSNKHDAAELQQAREQIQASISDILRQTAAKLGQKPFTADPSAPQVIPKAAEKLNLPELAQLWLLTEEDAVALPNRALPDGVASNRVPPDGALPSRMSADGALPDRTLSETASPKHVLPEGSLPEGGLSAMPVHKAITIQNVAETIQRLWQGVNDEQSQTEIPASIRQQSAGGVALSGNDSSAGLVNELKNFTQKLTGILTEFNLNADELDPVILQQARDQIRAAMPDVLKQASAELLAKQASTAGISIPLAVRQAAAALNLPELLQLWPLTDVELTALLENSSSTVLKQSANTVRTLAESVSKAFQAIGDDQGQAILFTLQMPFNGEPAQLQPVHIHIYHEKEQTKADGTKRKADTWVRLTLQPEYTGQVDTIFHLYGDEILDIKVVFANKQASLLFGETVPQIRKACGEFAFTLGDVSIV